MVVELDDGYWWPHTANTAYCEEKYAVSYYVAEWWNTISNLPILVLSLAAFIKTRRNPELQPSLVVWSYLACPVVVFGGSLLFHATLSRWGQLMDQLPMIWGCL